MHSTYNMMRKEEHKERTFADRFPKAPSYRRPFNGVADNGPAAVNGLRPGVVKARPAATAGLRAVNGRR